VGKRTGEQGGTADTVVMEGRRGPGRRGEAVQTEIVGEANQSAN